MLDMKIAYPEFVPNQILTDRQLNQLRTHLEQEDRLTRILLTGMGIVCGLHGRTVSTPDPGVQIVAGYGVASEGDLIELCETTTYTHFRPYADPDRDEDNRLKYLPWRNPANPTQQINIVELLSREEMAGSDPPEDATVFTPGLLGTTIAGRVLVLYLEHEPVDLNSCLVTSCDNKGRNINVRVRAVLVNRGDPLPGCPTPPTIHRLPRHHTKGVPQSSTQVADIDRAFSEIVTETAPAISLSIKRLFDAYAPFLNLPAVATDPLAGRFTGAGISQYRYDALVDVAHAYNETAAAAYTLVTECCPESTFPRHLMLGVLDGSSSAGFRHECAPSAVRNIMHGHIERVRDLFRRLDAMIFALDFGAHPSTVSVRPSHTAAYPLGRRARPFYFSGAGMDVLWRPRGRCTMDADWPWLRPAVATGLATDYAESTLLRIEGHVGQLSRSAPTAIASRRGDGNAEFDVICSYIDDAAGEERRLREELRRVLDIPTEAFAAARTGFARWVIESRDSFEGVIPLTHSLRSRDSGLESISRAWRSLRDVRTLVCDTTSIARDYLEARGEFLCRVGCARAIVRRAIGDVERLADEALLGEGLEVNAQATLVDTLVTAVAASSADWNTVEKIRTQLGATGGVDGAAALRPALRFTLRALDANLQRLVELVPARVSDFDYDVFAHFFRIALAHAREVWHWMRAIGVRIPDIKSPGDERGVDARLHPAEAATMAADWLGLQGCVLAKFATASVAYESARAHDVSLFRNLARIDGLEHLGGVSKGGTFVLVCDTPEREGRVVADLSLEGRLPCCCECDVTEVCLPPLALPDVRVITLAPGPGDPRNPRAPIEPVTLDIDVLTNDCDLNGGAGRLRIAARTDKSERGGDVQVNVERGTVTYTSPATTHPGMIDRFDYGVELTGKCEGLSAVGRVILVFTHAPVLLGRVEGIVWRGPDRRGDDAIVTIKETGQSLMTSGSGDFAFESLRVGVYTLSATQDDVAGSRPVSVQVQAGQTTLVNLFLEETGTPPTGSIDVRVRDQSGAALPGVATSIVNETGLRRTAFTEGGGVARFLDVPAGTYIGVVELSGTLVGRWGPTPLAAGQHLDVPVTLATRPAAPTGVLEFVAERRRIDLVDANTTVRQTLADRYGRVVDSFNIATRDPVIFGSDAYATAARFLGQQVTDPQVTDAALATSYRETSAALAGAAQRATGAQQAAYREALSLVTVAYLDRLAMANPRTLTTARTNEITAAARTLKTAGVVMDDVRSRWQGANLQSTMGLESVNAIEQLLV